MKKILFYASLLILGVSILALVAISFDSYKKLTSPKPDLNKKPAIESVKPTATPPSEVNFVRGEISAVGDNKISFKDEDNQASTEYIVADPIVIIRVGSSVQPTTQEGELPTPAVAPTITNIEFKDLKAGDKVILNVDKKDNIVYSITVTRE